MFRNCATALVSTALAGCFASVSAINAEAEDHGPEPRDFRAVSEAYFRSVLLDAASVEFGEISKPKKAWVGARIDGASYGWIVCVPYKAMTPQAAMLRFEDALLIRTGAVNLRVPAGDWFGRKLC